jgi:DNA-binding PadR family transcriptional regulator
VRYTFEPTKRIVLRATYEALVYHSDWETFGADLIQKRVETHFAAGFVRRALSSLSNDGLVDIEQYDETSSPQYTVTDKGLELAETMPSVAQLLKVGAPEVPGADRMVTIDHNQPTYQEIADGLDAAIELSKRTKPNEVSGDAHASLVVALEAARKLWNAFEMTRMQFEIGIIMAVEQAETALKVSFNLVKGPLLMEALKAFFNKAKDGDVF